MGIDWQSNYLQLGQLVSETPSDLIGLGPISADTHRWLGRVTVLIEAQAKDQRDAAIIFDQIAFSSAAAGLMGVLREHHAHEIVAMVHRALARAEQHAPAAARGAFIGVGATFDAVQAMSKVLREATKDVLVVEAYADATVLTDFLPLAPERVPIRLLIDRASSRLGSLKPAAERWVKQYGPVRPLEVRLSAPKALHDRLVIIDSGACVWNLSQSFNYFAARSPASITRFDSDVAAMKRDYYLPLWNAADPLGP